MKRILVIFLILFATPVYAQNIQVAGLSPGVIGAGVPPFSWEISETFTMGDGTTVTGWTEQLGNWAILNNTLDPPNDGNNIIYNNTALGNSARQYIKLQVLQTPNAGGQVMLINRLNLVSGDSYEVVFDDSNNSISIQFRDNWVYNSTSTASSVAVSLPGWVGVEVSGTGTSTVWQCWVWASDPGDWDAAHTNWGSPTATITADPAITCDSGTYVGIETYDYGASKYLDNFYAGSSSS